VDKFQGQQNDFILLSLVRTRFVGHLRDVRRLIVAMSRARLGLYVFCRRSLFEQCYELQPTFQLLLQRPDKLALNLDECTPFTERPLGETGNIYYVTGIEDIDHLVKFRLEHLRQVHFPAHLCKIKVKSICLIFQKSEPQLQFLCATDAIYAVLCSSSK
jgi:intron-binding protein aquarius